MLVTIILISVAHTFTPFCTTVYLRGPVPPTYVMFVVLFECTLYMYVSLHVNRSHNVTHLFVFFFTLCVCVLGLVWNVHSRYSPSSQSQAPSREYLTQ